MPTHLASLDSLVHPHQMEVQEFSSYSLVIDARCTEAYQEDHIPGAVSVPVAIQRLQVPKAEGTALVASDAGPSVPYALAAHLGGLSAGASVLIYCDRGGLDSLAWADPLKALGYRVDVLGGGWGNYRRWVDAGLEVLPRALTLLPLLGAPVDGSCSVLDNLVRQGEQVVDLPALAGQRLIPGLTLLGDTPPSQAAFETVLLDALRRLNSQRPVWVRIGLTSLGGLVLPLALRDALHRSSSVKLEVPVGVRVLAWSDRLEAMGTGFTTLLQAISASGMPPAAALIERWQLLADTGRLLDALAEIIERYIDPRSQLERWPGKFHMVRLESLKSDALDIATEEWLGTWERR